MWDAYEGTIGLIPCHHHHPSLVSIPCIFINNYGTFSNPPKGQKEELHHSSCITAVCWRDGCWRGTGPRTYTQPYQDRVEGMRSWVGMDLSQQRFHDAQPLKTQPFSYVVPASMPADRTTEPQQLSARLLRVLEKLPRARQACNYGNKISLWVGDKGEQAGQFWYPVCIQTGVKGIA